MQRLEFEPAWDKTVSPQDRQHIEKVFTATSLNNNEGVDFTFLREATNHRGDLLVTVLIHNFFDEKFSLKNVGIAYRRGEEIIAADTFNLPFEINPKTTMPWTLIYSEPHKTKLIPDFIVDWDLES